ncbi:MAG: hypothetical protein FWF29_04605, partial [Treponema sp.]|nr:hypothetical protein [Treponema sp.]
DIREIALHESVNWADMINDARQKDAGVELSYITEIMKTMPRSEFDQIHWIQNPGWDVFQSDIDKIAIQMLRASSD